MEEPIREFDTGALRDSVDGKLQYAGYINPLCDYSFAQYMQGKQIIGGKYRSGDNRQKGIPDDSLFDSLVRHMEILKLLRKGHRVYEYKDKNGIVHLDVDTIKIDDIPQAYGILPEEKVIITELNAIRFNCEALKLYYLKG